MHPFYLPFLLHRYSIKKPSNEKVFIATVKASVCMERDGSCMFEQYLMDNTEIPQIGCDWNVNFTGKTSF